MKSAAIRLAGALVALGAAPQAALAAAPSPAAGLDLFVSTDADHTDVIRAGANLDWSHPAEDRYQGVRVERAWFKPQGDKATTFDRVYGRYADTSGRYAWAAQVGTDGDTVIGSASVVDASPWRKEFFLERDILETRRGVSEGIYYTFGGAAFDIPFGERDTGSVVLGAQEFTGKNVRLHARANYVHVVQPDWGLSAQLRTRYFHSTHPGEFDYYSPRWFAEVLPVLQLRRHVGDWRLVLAGGYGIQRDANTDWRASRYVNAQLSSPVNRGVSVKFAAVYSNTPVGAGAIYDYLQVSAGIVARF